MSGRAGGGFEEYRLPPERVALYPAAERDSSRLLVVGRHGRRLEHHVFSELPGLLSPGDLLVLNDSRVFPARLRGVREGGGKVELLLTERLDIDGAGGVSPAGAAPAAGNGGGSAHRERWAVLARSAGKIVAGERWQAGPGLEGRVIARRRDERLEVELSGARPVLDVAAERGETPLPPYIRRAFDPAVDPERYQTIYARQAGSCAAPTAGLHFTERLLGDLWARGVRTAALTLHVGWATFRPLRPGDVFPPAVPAEAFVLPEETAAAVAETRRQGGRVIAVGTTSARVLEASAGEGGELRARSGWCDLTIGPQHSFAAIDALLTNFHLPRTTLLMLVSSFAGARTARAAYEEALRAGYRFYSYGDAMLVLNEV